MLYIVLLLVLAALGLVVAALVTASSLWAWVSIGLSGLAGTLLVVDWLRRRSSSAADADPVGGADTTGPVNGEDGAAPATKVGTGITGADRDGDREPGGEPHVEADTETEPGSRVDAAGTGTKPAVGVEAATGTADTGTDTPASGGAATDGGAGGRAGGDQGDGETRRDRAGDAATEPEPRTALLVSSGELTGAETDPPEENTAAADVPLVAELDAEVLVVDEYPRYHLAECTWLGRRATIPLAVKEARDLGFTPCGLCGPDATLAAAHRGKRASKK